MVEDVTYGEPISFGLKQIQYQSQWEPGCFVVFITSELLRQKGFEDKDEEIGGGAA